MEHLCVVNWVALGMMLAGIGSLILGVSAALTLGVQWGARKEAEELKKTVKERDLALAETERLRAKAQDTSDKYERVNRLIMASVYEHFDEWFPGSEGIVFGDPEDKAKIAEIIGKRMKLEPSLVAEMLENLSDGGSIEG